MELVARDVRPGVVAVEGEEETDLLVLLALGEEDEAADQVLEGDAPRGAPAGYVQPLGYRLGHSVAQHVHDEALLGEELVAAAESLECFAYPLEFLIGHCGKQTIRLDKNRTN